ncbi:hypothetical protein Poly24_47770 [Rosistilla carotiformis]|uniref:Uncharacterized protein n=1 Tax=Rosistilla carotiformis TaxID=2528017 RepID=A0A518JZS2_9BACT|nr:hypothetical protein Poly24_47770 [Rosistilla carotiformis]
MVSRRSALIVTNDRTAASLPRMATLLQTVFRFLHGATRPTVYKIVRLAGPSNTCPNKIREAKDTNLVDSQTAEPSTSERRLPIHRFKGASGKLRDSRDNAKK